MDFSADLPLVVLSEVLFLALVGIIVWQLVVRQRLRKSLEDLARYQRLCDELREEKDDLRQDLLQAKDILGDAVEKQGMLLRENERLRLEVKRLIENSTIDNKNNGPNIASLSLQNSDMDKKDEEIKSYQKRITNLEKFKDLYFKMEQRFDSLSDHGESDKELIETLREEVALQDKVIGDLKKYIEDASQKYALESVLSKDLKEAVAGLEASQEKWRYKLKKADKEQKSLEQELQYLGQFKRRAMDLQSNEAKLNKELAESRRKIQELKLRKDGKRPFGIVRVAEIDNLSSKLSEKETEIYRLRKECETIAMQYEELALKSLDLASKGTDLSQQEKADLEELKQKLKTTSLALEHKRAECEMLENYCLEIEEEAELSKANMAFQESMKEFDNLQDQRTGVVNQMGRFFSQDISEDLVSLNKRLIDTEEALKSSREEYQQLKVQFMELAKEDNDLRIENRNLRQQEKRLKSKVQELQVELKYAETEREELIGLRSEYIKMEERYLAMVEKYRSLSK